MKSLTLIIWNDPPQGHERARKKENGESAPYFFEKIMKIKVVKIKVTFLFATLISIIYITLKE